MTQLYLSHVLGFDDLNYDEGVAEEEEVEVVDKEVVANEDTQGSVKRSRTQNMAHKKTISTW
jgi:hypothetical protein